LRYGNILDISRKNHSLANHQKHYKRKIEELNMSGTTGYEAHEKPPDLTAIFLLCVIIIYT